MKKSRDCCLRSATYGRARKIYGWEAYCTVTRLLLFSSMFTLWIARAWRATNHKGLGKFIALLTKTWRWMRRQSVGWLLNRPRNGIRSVSYESGTMSVLVLVTHRPTWNSSALSKLSANFRTCCKPNTHNLWTNVLFRFKTHVRGWNHAGKFWSRYVRANA